MISTYRLNELIHAANAEGVERQAAIARQAGAALREVGMTPNELDRYQDRIAGIETRFAMVTARRLKKPVRLFR